MFSDVDKITHCLKFGIPVPVKSQSLRYQQIEAVLSDSEQRGCDQARFTLEAWYDSKFWMTYSPIDKPIDKRGIMPDGRIFTVYSDDNRHATLLLSESRTPDQRLYRVSLDFGTLVVGGLCAASPWEALKNAVDAGGKERGTFGLSRLAGLISEIEGS